MKTRGLVIALAVALLVSGGACGASSHPVDEIDAEIDAGTDASAPDAEADAGVLRRCADDGVTVEEWNEAADIWEPVASCDLDERQVCLDGECRDACDAAVESDGAVACEHWAVDLDNVSLSVEEDASAQRSGVVVANPGSVDVRVTVEINEALPGEPLALEVVQESELAPGALVVIELPRREVDGTPDGAFGYQEQALGFVAGSYLSSRAFRISSDHPVVAYQFNPLVNQDAFSSDGSLLLPASALTGDYVALAWPQTIADTDDPGTDFDMDLKTFLTVVGTAANTRVAITLRTATRQGDNVPARAAGESFEVTLGAFDVLNLETAAFGADFTGTTVVADEKVVVFTGSESSDVPLFDSLSSRTCCANHLEEQLAPTATLGRHFIVTPMPARAEAISEAGRRVDAPDEVVIVRILAVDPGVTNVEVGLPRRTPIALQQFEHIDVPSTEPFAISADQRISVGEFVVGQQAIPIDASLPGGDPSFLLVPPVEQFRTDYVFLTPEGFAFDFLVVVAPSLADLQLDGSDLEELCDGQPVDREMTVYRCALSFPTFEEPEGTLDPGIQGDGPHRLHASEPVGALLYGFDSFTSYALPAGMSLRRTR